MRAARTAPVYRLYALAGPRKPGLVRVDDGAGASVEVEVWELEEAAFGSFVADDISRHGGWRAYLAGREGRDG